MSKIYFGFFLSIYETEIKNQSKALDLYMKTKKCIENSANSCAHINKFLMLKQRKTAIKYMMIITI